MLGSKTLHVVLLLSTAAVGEVLKPAGGVVVVTCQVPPQRRLPFATAGKKLRSQHARHTVRIRTPLSTAGRPVWHSLPSWNRPIPDYQDLLSSVARGMRRPDLCARGLKSRATRSLFLFLCMFVRTARGATSRLAAPHLWEYEAHAA